MGRRLGTPRSWLRTVLVMVAINSGLWVYFLLVFQPPPTPLVFGGPTSSQVPMENAYAKNLAKILPPVTPALESQRKALVLAVYFPQFHPDNLNDGFWGRGFTDWTNTARARPVFKGHYQPHIPADLGFYDLRLEETRLAQQAYARAHGIHGFIWYHYWFSNGTRVLTEPFKRMFENPKKETFPFALSWANEKWHVRWNLKFSRPRPGDEPGATLPPLEMGQELLRQEYNEENFRAHIRWLKPVFTDPRYIRTKSGKALFIVHEPLEREIVALGGPKWMSDIFRDEARKYGVELALCHDSMSVVEEGPAIGFDCQMEWHPTLPDIGPSISDKVDIIEGKQEYYNIHDYQAYATERFHQQEMRMSDNEAKQKTKERGGVHIMGVTPMYDRSARFLHVLDHKKYVGIIQHNSTPQSYGTWLRNVIDLANRTVSAEPATGLDGEAFVVVNAWNEWGEGNHLEPDLRWGSGYLDETRAAVFGLEQPPSTTPLE